MATRSGDRADYFPAIERKYGQPMSYWFDRMDEIKDRKYPEQIAYLREEHGFSQAHANALVLYSRGSTSSRRFATLEEYLAPLDETKQKTIRTILSTITRAFPSLEVVIAWNKPMVKDGTRYVFGVAEAANHLLIAPFDADLIARFRPRLEGYEVNKKTIRVPVDWKVDKALLRDMVAAQLAESGT